MSSKVSARVPDELRFQVDDKLARIGANVTQLVNAAYEYVLHTGELPVAAAESRPQGGGLDAAQLETLRLRLDRTTCPVPETFFAGRTYDDILEEELHEAYEALA